MTATTVVPLAPGDLERLGHVIALLAGDIAKQLVEAIDHVGPLLDNIVELDACAEATAWTRAGASGPLSPAGMTVLRKLRDADADMLRLTIEQDWHQDDIADQRWVLERFDRMIALVDPSSRWAACR